jgi:membrane associated rhomboid family serine protease
MFLPIKDYNPTRRLAIVTVLLIAANVLVFINQYYFTPSFGLTVARSAMVPYEISHFQRVDLPVRTNLGQELLIARNQPPLVTLLAALFMHGSWLHLLGNMLFLWIFGNNIEDRLGHLLFLVFYLLGGVGSSLVHVLFNSDSLTPVLGASGAVSAVMGAYLILYPQARIRTLVFLFIFITFVDLPAALFLIIWFIFQFAYAGQSSGIAWLAHVGGFILGVLFLKLLDKKEKPRIEFIQ